ncbi:MAG: lytic transglycosylase domain-containing protein, partial [Patescibacteria group bacterium]|nr:lytic transglycosylase domain-containing protein [Patescibacteria group bacterium]
MSNTDTIYRQTGIPPWQQAQMTKQDPGLHEEVLAKDVNGNPVLPRFNAMRPDEPDPFKTNAHKLQDEHNEEVSGLTGQAFVNAHVENLLPMVRQLEGSGDDAVSPVGAVGRYQIMPGTARQYGFDPALLKDPAYNERAARTVLADLVKRFHGDREAILIAYNAGPGRAFKFLADGRDRSQLPAETQRYLAHAEDLKGISGQPLEKLPAEPAQEQGIDYEKASFGDLVADVQRKVGQPVTRSASPLLGFETDLDFARRVDRRMIAEGLLDSKKELTLEDMARQTKGSDSRLLHFMREGPVTFNGFDAPSLYGKGEGPSFQDIMDDIQKADGTTEEFNAYRLAARTVEKAQQGIDLGVLDGGVKQAQAILSHPEAAKYAPINAKMQIVKNGMLEYVRQSGLRNADQIGAMQRLNTSHVSVRKLEGDTKAFQFSGKSGLLKARDPFFRMTGGKKDKIVDTVLADIDNMSRMQSAADKNIAARFATDNPERMRLSGITLVSKPKGDPDAALSDDLKGMAPFVEDKALTKTQFPVWRDGKKWVYEAHDEYTARLFRMAEGPGEVNFILKALQLPAKIARAGITTDPTFGGRVVLKHGNTAFVFSEHHPPPFVTALRGVLDSFGHGDAFWEFARNGGLQSTMVNMDRNLVQAEAYHTLETEGRLKKLWNTVSHPIELGQMWNDALSNSGRIGEMKTLIARGVRPDKATMAARKDFLDFQEQFASGALNTMAKYVPFFKADILGLKQGQEGLRP